MTEYTDPEAYEVGVLQKQYINWIQLAYVIAFFIPYATWVVGIAAAYFVFKIAEAQKSPVAWLWALSQVIPFVGLVCLLILSQNATRILRGKGVKVGLLGAKAGELNKLVPPEVAQGAQSTQQKFSYTAYGAHRYTGNDMNITVQAVDENEAIKEANRCGVLVSRVVSEAGTTSKGAHNRTLIKIAGGVAAVGLIFVVLMVLGSLVEQAVGPSGDTTAVASKACWRSMAQIDLELHSLMTKDPVTFWEQNYIRYGTIDLDNVDPDLKSLIKDWGALSVDMHNELKQMQSELQEIDATGNSMMELGASLGSTSRENPQGGAAAGTILGGLLALPYQTSAREELNKRHEPAMTKLTQRINELISQFQQIRPVLEQRYGVEFD